MGNGEVPPSDGEQSELTDLFEALQSYVADDTPIDPELKEKLIEADRIEIMKNLVPSVNTASDPAEAASRFATIAFALLKKEALLERVTQERPSEFIS